jgi:crotonobetainyl-CoA:carnitine CoA-transferase CaiB-like acyl-CoA transferase
MARTGLEGIRVLEVAGGVGPTYVAKLFGDLGADVIRYEGDGSSSLVRQRPHDVHRWLNVNKRSVTSGLTQLVREADVVLHSLTGRAAAQLGLDADTVTSDLPRLVVCSMTPFGSTGPYAEYAAEELNVMHGSSWGFLSPSAASDPELPPLKAPGHHSTLIVVQAAATAALAAVHHAGTTGRGEHIDFSQFAAAAKLTETAPPSANYLGVDASRLGVKTLVPWDIYPCADGLMQFICVEDAHWESFKELMGSPEWADLEVFDNTAGRQDNTDVLNLYIGEWTVNWKVADLYEAGQAARLCMTPVNTMEQLDNDPHFAARGFFAETSDGLRLPGAGFQTDQPWWQLRLDAPELGQHDGEGWLAREDSEGILAAPTADAPDDAPTRPLDGVRVCDFTWVWAGPFCTQYLGHLGADVVRLESPEHLCLFRRLPFNPPDVPMTPDSVGGFHTYNTDKRSVGIDLATAEAKEVVRRLVEISDVVIDNFGVGVMAQLGFGADDLRAINPDVIIVSLTGYGQDGPSAPYMAYGPAGGAVSGLYAANGYAGGAARETGVAVGDPGTGLTAAWATVAALAARERAGEVARIDIAMSEAIAATLGEPWMHYISTGEVPVPDGNRDPQWAPHGCYPAEGDDQWITIACTSDESWQALSAVIGAGLAADERFATMESRKANEDALDEIVSVWTAERDRWAVCEQLQSQGVAAFPSVSPLELWTKSPQLEAIGMLETPEHPVTGRHVVPGIPWRLTNGPNGIQRVAPMLGEHTDEVLTTMLGFSDDQVAAMHASGALP